MNAFYFSIFSDPSHGQVYDPENVSHYARQSSHSKILVNKVEHYNVSVILLYYRCIVIIKLYVHI